MYAELARLRQSMNAVPHVEPDGSEAFPYDERPERQHGATVVGRHALSEG
jgi:hypothetical protein